jgi:hypothetical protein
MKATYEEYKKECKFLRVPAVDCSVLFNNWIKAVANLKSSLSR